MPTGINSTGFTWDIENRLVWQAGANSGSYGYDPWGKRVVQNESSFADDTGVYTLINFYSITGQRLVTYRWKNDQNGQFESFITLGMNLYFGGKLLQANGVAVATDRLGPVRGNANGEKFAYYPYGKERTTTASNREKFGTYYQDFGDQYYADQRYYSSYWPGFYSSDPGGLQAAHPSDPGSWNLYAYVGGDPVNRNDPTGQEWVCTGTEDDWTCHYYPDPHPDVITDVAVTTQLPNWRGPPYIRPWVVKRMAEIGQELEDCLNKASNDEFLNAQAFDKNNPAPTLSVPLGENSIYSYIIAGIGQALVAAALNPVGSTALSSLANFVGGTTQGILGTAISDYLSDLRHYNQAKWQASWGVFWQAYSDCHKKADDEMRAIGQGHI